MVMAGVRVVWRSYANIAWVNLAIFVQISRLSAPLGESSYQFFYKLRRFFYHFVKILFMTRNKWNEMNQAPTTD